MKQALRTLILILAIFLSLTIFTSCNNNNVSNEDTENQNVVKIPYPITEYSVVRPERAPAEILQASVSLRKQINQLLTDSSIPIIDDWVKGGVITDEIANSKEILIGHTTRPESAQALEGIDSTSFVIKVIGNKIVINAEKIEVTGKKRKEKIYKRHTGYPGGLRETTFEKLQARKPEEIIRHAVKGMLPDGKLGRQMLKKLKVYAGTEHAHAAQKPETLEF